MICLVNERFVLCCQIVPSVAIGFTAYDTVKGWLHIPPHQKAQSITSAA